MSDEGRYNMLPAIAAGLGLETSANAALWRDAAMLALNQVHIKASSGKLQALVSRNTLSGQDRSVVTDKIT